MGYKLLGMIVWKGGKLYLRRRMGGARRMALVGGGGTLVAAGVAGAAIAMGRRRASG
jgi:hypothetical protein